MATLTPVDCIGGVCVLVGLTVSSFVWVWLWRDSDEQTRTPVPLASGRSVHVVQDVYIDGRIIAHRGECVLLASRVLYRDHGACWSATSNGRHLFPIPEWALSVDSIQG